MKHYGHKGFTLMEVMVAVTIFAIVMTVGIGSLLTINDAYRKSQTQREGIDSLTYVLESMSRRVRTAYSWSASNMNGTSSQFSFKDQDMIDVSYYLSGTNIMMGIVNNPDSTNTTLMTKPDYNVTPDNVSITSLKFTAFNTPGTTPYVQVNIQGTVTNGRTTSDFSLQTGVSKRSGEPTP